MEREGLQKIAFQPRRTRIVKPNASVPNPACNRPRPCVDYSNFFSERWPSGRRQRFAKPSYEFKLVPRVRIPPSPVTSSFGQAGHAARFFHSSGFSILLLSVTICLSLVVPTAFTYFDILPGWPQCMCLHSQSLGTDVRV